MTISGSKTDEGLPAISDRELMRYLDGELDEPDLTELEARLATDEQASGKLAGLEQVGDFLRETVSADDRADCIADAIMAQIEAEAADGAEADSAGADSAGDGDAKVVELPRAPALETLTDRQVADGPPANDNSRLIYAVFGAAAAAAAALFVWGNAVPTSDTVAMASRPAVATEVAAAAEAAPGLPPSGKVDTEAAAEDEDEPVVEIAAVDFGAQSGSVFYVSAGKHTAGSTAVVWVTDLGE